MYLYATKRGCNTDWANDEEKAFVKAVKQAVPEIYDSGNLNSVTVKFEVAYWRKANHIHKWFVENVQDGKDDCGDYYVSVEQLGDLLVLCKQVVKECPLVDGQVSHGQRMVDGEWQDILKPGKMVKNPERAAELLPTSSGFFFGCIDYDQWYMADIQETIDQLERALKLKGWDYEYHSSW